MSKLVRAPPKLRLNANLCSDGQYPLQHRLDEPLIGSSRTPLLPYDFMALCGELEVLLEKQLLDAGVPMERHTWIADYTADDIYARMQNVMYELDPSTTPIAYFEESQYLPVIFPHTASYLGVVPTAGGSNHDLNDYLLQVRALNQIRVLCRQLRHDLAGNTHKYYAHQIALLYQSVGAVGTHLADYKKEIEGHFDVIKKQIEGRNDARLSPEEERWLRTFTTSLEDHVLKLPKDITRRCAAVQRYVGDHPVRGAVPGPGLVNP